MIHQPSWEDEQVMIDFFHQIRILVRTISLSPPSLCRALTGVPLSWGQVRRMSRQDLTECQEHWGGALPCKGGQVWCRWLGESLQQLSELEVKGCSTQNCLWIQLLIYSEQGRVLSQPFCQCQLWIWWDAGRSQGSGDQNQKNFFSPESWPSWLDDGHANFPILAILAKVIKVLSFVQIWHSGGGFGSSVSLLGDFLTFQFVSSWRMKLSVSLKCRMATSIKCVTMMLSTQQM